MRPSVRCNNFGSWSERRIKRAEMLKNESADIIYYSFYDYYYNLQIQMWWLSGLNHHVSNSSRDRRFGPELVGPTVTRPVQDPFSCETPRQLTMYIIQYIRVQLYTTNSEQYTLEV